MNQQTAHIKRAAVVTKIDGRQPITKAELSVFLGVAYSLVRSWEWLPMLGGLIFYDDFIEARRRRVGLADDPRIGARRRKSSAGKSC
jgi:hypothetical protein